MGAPYKRALRNLASEYLKKIIQNDGKDCICIDAFCYNQPFHIGIVSKL